LIGQGPGGQIGLSPSTRHFFDNFDARTLQGLADKYEYDALTYLLEGHTSDH